MDLLKNYIERIIEYNFLLILLNGLDEGGLDFSYNKFFCNCDDVLWFYNWMYVNKKKLLYVEDIIC